MADKTGPLSIIKETYHQLHSEIQTSTLPVHLKTFFSSYTSDVGNIHT